MAPNKAFEKAFGKYSEKQMDAEPIRINRNAGATARPEEASAEKPEERKVERQGRGEAASEPAGKKAAKESKAAGADALVNVIFQVTEPMKRMLDEMKYKLRITYRDILTEALNDFYEKKRGELN